MANCIWIAISFANNTKTILIHLKPTERITLRLRPLFFGIALALAEHSINAGIFKKKSRMLLFLGKNPRLSSMKIIAILGPL